MRAAQHLRDDVAAERAAFAAWQPTVDGARVGCVDESGGLAGLRTAYGYAPRGARGPEHAPLCCRGRQDRKGRRTSLIRPVLERDGWVRASGGTVVAVERSVGGAAFARFVAEHLAPALGPGARPRRSAPATWWCGTTPASTGAAGSAR